MLMTRESLKNLFKKGKFPSENHFAHLIDSTVNRMEDGIGKSPKNGLQLSPQGENDQLLSFFERMDLQHPEWQFNLQRQGPHKGLSVDKVVVDENGMPQTESRLFLAKSGNIGINTASPWAPVHVNGTLGSNARIGTHTYGKVPGNGEWQPILTKLTGVQAYEVVARIDGPKGKGKYAITHAIALSAFGGKHPAKRIKQTRAYYGWFWNRIDFKWEGDVTDYRLMVRTRQNYGRDENEQPNMIKFHITKLWDDDLLNSDDLPLVDLRQEKPAT